MRQNNRWILGSLVAAVAVGSLWTNSIVSARDKDKVKDKDKDGLVRTVADERPAPSEAKPADTKDITLTQAYDALQAALQKAKDTNVKMNIAVVDAGGNLKAFGRMDGAWLGSIDIAIKKAKTSRYFDMETGKVGELSQPGKPLYMIEVSNGGLITFPGGVPIKAPDGTIIGAIGVSGGLVDQDRAVATAGAQAVK